LNIGENNSSNTVVSVAEAMATTFRIHVTGWPEKQARQAAGAAFEELHRLERSFSRFVDGSDIDQINRAKPGQPVRVRADTFACLASGLEIEPITGGAFNITARQADSETPVWTTAKSARESLSLDQASLTVQRLFQDTRIDLGGIGKGFAVDGMVQILQDWDVPSALVDAGGSTVFAYSAPDRTEPWTASLQAGNRTAVLSIDNFGFAASGVSVKGDHIVDTRTGKAASSKMRTWALAPRASIADALSTAFFIMNDSDIDKLCEESNDVGAAWIAADTIRNVGRLADLSWTAVSDSV
jgi:thiamine biosynthesis lipoprotein